LRIHQADDLEELRQAWAPALTQAKTLLSELSALQEAYTPALEAIARRDFAALPPMARTLNGLAGGTLRWNAMRVLGHRGSRKRICKMGS
jgi:hypothetical protein